jgi:hypothetical protein
MALTWISIKWRLILDQLAATRHSLLLGKIQGKLERFGVPSFIFSRIGMLIQLVTRKFPAFGNREFDVSVQGVFAREQGSCS